MSQIDKLGVAIADAAFEWTPAMRTAWDAAKNEDDRRATELTLLRGLLRECMELSENWPGIAYTADLEKRAASALTPNQNISGGLPSAASES